MPEVAALVCDTEEGDWWFYVVIIILCARDQYSTSVVHESVDSSCADGHSPAMRVLVILALLIPVAACSSDPQSYGITGPGSQTSPTPAHAPAGDDTGAMPGVPTSGSYYGPSTRPVTGGSGFWGYN